MNRRATLLGGGAALAATLRPEARAAAVGKSRAGLLLTGSEIVGRVHAAAGGATWLRPGTLTMTGRGVFYPKGNQASRIEAPDYRMWRVYPQTSTDAHVANGMVRIDARQADGRFYFQTAFDGVDTYGPDGRIPGAQASKEWSENFGFGIIRYALDPGFTVDRFPDDSADGRPTFVIRINDPQGGRTLFGVAQDDFAILWLGFSTPRGWHERRYSRFFRKPGVSFTQPGLVRLFYDGVKQNEIVWTDYAVGRPLPLSLFRLTKPPL